MSRLTIWITRGAIASASPTVELVSRFARTVILSRVLIPNEFGTAVAISVMISFSWMITDVALDRFVLIEADEATLAAAHILSIGRAVLMAIALWIGAPSIAAIFGVPQFSSSFAYMAFVPLLEGFVHFGIKQIQRDYHYLPETISKVASALVGLIVIWPALAIFGDHRVVVASFIAEKAIFVVASHLLARESYSLITNKSTLLAALRFGLPLTLNGLGLAAFSQLDRIIVGHWFGVESLANYAVILNVGIIPMSLLSQIMGRLGVSYLLGGSKKLSAEADTYHLMVVLYFVVAVAYALWVALTLDVLTVLIFGRNFVVNPYVHVLITVIAFFRLQRSGAPSIFLVATSRTRELAFINLASGFGLAAAVLFVALSPHLESMLFGILLGDILVLILFLFISSARIVGRGRGSVFDFWVAVLAISSVAGSLAWEPQFSWKARGFVLVVGLSAMSLQATLSLIRHKYIRNLLFGGSA